MNSCQFNIFSSDLEGFEDIKTYNLDQSNPGHERTIIYAMVLGSCYTYRHRRALGYLSLYSTLEAYFQLILEL